jgi:transposase
MIFTTIGLDIAKEVFHAACCNEQGKLVKKKVIKRAGVLAFFNNIPRCVVAIEACATAHYWAREIECCSHTVNLFWSSPTGQGN